MTPPAARNDLQALFQRLKPLLAAYRPPLIARVETDSRFDLVSQKEVLIAGRRRPEIYFASLIIQKSYVGFYFMPVYTQPEMKALFRPELLARLKGKSCFHIQKLEDTLLDQVQSALQAGFELYQQRGWV